MKCLKCGSECVFIERKLNGDATCWECFYIGKPEEFRRKTNFDRITESPEALAKEMVFETIKGVWRYRIGEKISVQNFRSRWEAERGTVEYLKQEV